MSGLNCESAAVTYLTENDPGLPNVLFETSQTNRNVWACMEVRTVENRLRGIACNMFSRRLKTKIKMYKRPALQISKTYIFKTDHDVQLSADIWREEGVGGQEDSFCFLAHARNWQTRSVSAPPGRFRRTAVSADLGATVAYTRVGRTSLVPTSRETPRSSLRAHDAINVRRTLSATRRRAPGDFSPPRVQINWR